jgi:hypothetical protein
LYDGEQERRIHYNGVTAKETAVTTFADVNSTRLVAQFLRIELRSSAVPVLYENYSNLRT